MRVALAVIAILLLCVQASVRASAIRQQGPDVGSQLRPPRRKFILDHDGGIDDIIAMMILLSQPSRVQLLGIVVIEGDCMGSVAVNTTLKLLHLVGVLHVPVAYSTLPPVNPFPDKWRWAAANVDALPLLNNLQPGDMERMHDRQLSSQPGQEFLGQLLLKQSEPVTLIVTGPLSNLAYALQLHGQAVACKIAEVWWMGGALRVPGNVYERHVTSNDLIFYLGSKDQDLASTLEGQNTSSSTPGSAAAAAAGELSAAGPVVPSSPHVEQITPEGTAGVPAAAAAAAAGGFSAADKTNTVEPSGPPWDGVAAAVTRAAAAARAAAGVSVTDSLTAVDGSAEWNAFWDPAALGVVWNSSVPLTLVPLDATNQVPITLEHVYSYGPQARHLFSNLAGTMYSSVISRNASNPPGYYAWDALATACAVEPGLCSIERNLSTRAVVSGPGQGAIRLVDEEGWEGSGAEGAAGAGGPATAATADLACRHGGSMGCSEESIIKKVAAVTSGDFYSFILRAFSQS